MLGVSLRNYIQNEQLRRRSGAQVVIDTIALLLKWNWADNSRRSVDQTGKGMEAQRDIKCVRDDHRSDGWMT